MVVWELGDICWFCVCVDGSGAIAMQISFSISAACCFSCVNGHLWLHSSCVFMCMCLNMLCFLVFV